jgi:hypothetical protein
MSNLAGEVLLRLAKAGAALVLGAVIYWLVVGPLGQPGSVELALLAWLAATGFVLLVQESPL